MREGTVTEEADRLARKRARVSAALAVIFIASQGVALSNGRANGHFDIPFLLWSLILGAILLFGGAWFRKRDVRHAMNDETTVAHRREGMAYGFVAAVLIALLLYALTFFEDLTAREAVRLVVTIGVATALLRFARLERRALRA